MVALTEHPFAGARLGAVEELSRLLASSNQSVVLAARQTLEWMVNDDSKRVAERASEALADLASDVDVARHTAPADAEQLAVDSARIRAEGELARVRPQGAVGAAAEESERPPAEASRPAAVQISKQPVAQMPRQVRKARVAPPELARLREQQTTNDRTATETAYERMQEILRPGEDVILLVAATMNEFRGLVALTHVRLVFAGESADYRDCVPYKSLASAALDVDTLVIRMWRKLELPPVGRQSMIRLHVPEPSARHQIRDVLESELSQARAQRPRRGELLAASPRGAAP